MKRAWFSAALLTASALVLTAAAGSAGTSRHALPLPVPAWSDTQLINQSETPPTEAQCESVGRRCFAPQAIQSAYNVGPLYDRGLNGSGQTIAIVDAYGSDTIAHDLHVFDTAFGLAPMCGEEGVPCAPGMPTFTRLSLQGTPATKAPPSQSKGTGQEDKSSWALEVSLDVETAHAIAPGANILLVTTPTAETLGVQGFPQMMAGVDYVVTHHLANVVSMSLAATEQSFNGPGALEHLRYAFKDAAASGVSVLAGSGDFGSLGVLKQPVSQGGSTLPFPAVWWPASDPLVTGIGGTYLCTDPIATVSEPRTVDSIDPPSRCRSNPGQAEVGWIDAGGGFSAVFPRPSYQDTLPAGSTPIPTSSRGVPDVSLEASATTGALIYITLPPDGAGGLICGTTPCSTGWYDIGGTSLATPQWAGLVAIADQLAGHGLGLLNPALYQLASNPATYANDFYDVVVGNNGAGAPAVPGYPASPGWDPVTGLGTPNAANLVPDLVAAS
ncbi:MAG TPA: S53 family peptidase [Gaiellaceae bacterium]|jgi:subtilase family serine protease